MENPVMKEALLKALSHIELQFAGVYEGLSRNPSFSAPARNFWKSMADEERLHARAFDDVLALCTGDDAPQLTLSIGIDELRLFTAKVNYRLSKISILKLTEQEAYSFGATLEADLDEAALLRSIKTNDRRIAQILRGVEADTKKHRAMLIDHAQQKK